MWLDEKCYDERTLALTLSHFDYKDLGELVYVEWPEPLWEGLHLEAPCVPVDVKF